MVLYLSGNLFNKAEMYKGKILGMINGYQNNKETNTKNKIEIYYIKYYEKLYELSRIVWLDNIIYSIPNDDAMIYYKEKN